MKNIAKPPSGSRKQGDRGKSGGGIEMPADLLAEFGLTVWEADLDENLDAEDERRSYQRINRGDFLDQEIAILTNNLTKNIPSRDMLLDISAGGLLLVSDRRMDFGDILRLEFRIGGMEKVILKGEVKRKKDRTYGVKFISPPPEIVESIERLYGSVRLNKSHRGQQRREG
ncbi:MAG: hypothetical protein AUK28_10670 [Desulfobacterales bacterium CG2_30_60_27]|nr:MAG: hypothetical protein AUK28_10670 [Desulfobacterales bacterium CG2_30_60_27]